MDPSFIAGLSSRFCLRLSYLCRSFDDQRIEPFAALGQMGNELFAHARVPIIIEVRCRLFHRILAGVAFEKVGYLIGHAHHVPGFHKLLLLKYHDAALGEGCKF